VIRASIVALAASALFGPTSHATDVPSPYQAAVHLSGKIGSRPSASRNERRAHDYVARQFRAGGLDVQVDPFEVPGRGRSRNVIGRIDRPGNCLVILMADTDFVRFTPYMGVNRSRSRS
jgi:hypothetical protein